MWSVCHSLHHTMDYSPWGTLFVRNQFAAVVWHRPLIGRTAIKLHIWENIIHTQYSTFFFMRFNSIQWPDIACDHHLVRNNSTYQPKQRWSASLWWWWFLLFFLFTKHTTFSIEWTLLVNFSTSTKLSCSERFQFIYADEVRENMWGATEATNRTTSHTQWWSKLMTIIIIKINYGVTGSTDIVARHCAMCV